MGAHPGRYLFVLRLIYIDRNAIHAYGKFFLPNLYGIMHFNKESFPSRVWCQVLGSDPSDPLWPWVLEIDGMSATDPQVMVVARARMCLDANACDLVLCVYVNMCVIATPKPFMSCAQYVMQSVAISSEGSGTTYTIGALIGITTLVRAHAGLWCRLGAHDVSA